MPESEEDRQKRLLKELEGKNIAHYSVLLNSWIQTKMERDKTLVTLSSAGIALLVTILTTAGIVNWIIIIFVVGALLGFGICIWSSLMIYQLNSQHIENELRSVDSSNLKLEKYDKRSLKSFILGVSCLCLVGIATASIKYINTGETKMADDRETTSQGSEIVKKSLDGLTGLRPEVVTGIVQPNPPQQQGSSNNSSQDSSGKTNGNE